MRGIDRRKFLTGASSAVAALSAAAQGAFSAMEGSAVQQEQGAPMPPLP